MYFLFSFCIVLYVLIVPSVIFLLGLPHIICYSYVYFVCLMIISSCHFYFFMSFKEYFLKWNIWFPIYYSQIHKKTWDSQLFSTESFFSAVSRKSFLWRKCLWTCLWLWLTFPDFLIYSNPIHQRSLEILMFLLTKHTKSISLQNLPNRCKLCLLFTFGYFNILK